MKRLTRYTSSVQAFWLVALVLVGMYAGCKKDDASTTGTTPVVVVPPQTTLQATVNLRSTAGFVVLAGSLVSNVPTSAITGNIGLSPAARSLITGLALAEVTGAI